MWIIGAIIAIVAGFVILLALGAARAGGQYDRESEEIFEALGEQEEPL